MRGLISPACIGSGMLTNIALPAAAVQFMQWRLNVSYNWLRKEPGLRCVAPFGALIGSAFSRQALTALSLT
jgi:hypothetical protein